MSQKFSEKLQENQENKKNKKQNYLQLQIIN